MMKISLRNVGKRFNTEWIFRNFSYDFTNGMAYAITGPNGSGKSTLLQIIAGATICNDGNIKYINGNSISSENIYRYISIAAPYLELIEEMTLMEFLQFHNKHKRLTTQLPLESIIDIIGLASSSSKQIRYFSSGMKQRLKLAQAIFSDVTVLLLDEPTTNLDNHGIDLYYKLISDYCSGKLIIVSSNDKNEYQFCKQVISMSDYRGTASATRGF